MAESRLTRRVRGRAHWVTFLTCVVLLAGSAFLVTPASAKTKSPRIGPEVVMSTQYGVNNENTQSFTVKKNMTPWVVSWTRTCPQDAAPLAQVLQIDVQNKSGLNNTLAIDSSGAPSGMTPPYSSGVGRFHLAITSGCNWSMSVKSVGSEKQPAGTLLSTQYGANNENTPTFGVKNSESPWVVRWTRTCPQDAAPLAQVLQIDVQNKRGLNNTLAIDSSGAPSGATLPYTAVGAFHLAINSGCNWSVSVISAKDYHGAEAPSQASVTASPSGISPPNTSPPPTTPTTAPPPTTTAPPPPPPTTTTTNYPFGPPLGNANATVTVTSCPTSPSNGTTPIEASGTVTNHDTTGPDNIDITVALEVRDNTISADFWSYLPGSDIPGANIMVNNVGPGQTVSWTGYNYDTDAPPYNCEVTEVISTPS